MGDKRNFSRYLWCTLTITTVALGVFLCVKFYTETKNESSYQRHVSSSPEKRVDEKCISVCNTKECVYQSKLLYDYVNTKVNPCEDFYEFACGKSFEKLDEGESFNANDRFGRMLVTKVKHLLDSIEEADSTSPAGKLKAVYDSCMQYSSNEFQAVPTVLQLLDSFGINDWPRLTPDFIFNNNSLARVIANFLLYNEYAFVEFNPTCTILEAFMLCGRNTSLKSSKSFYETQDKPSRKYLVNRVLKYFKLDVKSRNTIWEESEAIHDAIINLKEESKRFVQEEENSTTSFLDCKQRTENEWNDDLCESLKHFIESGNMTSRVNEDLASIEAHEEYFMQNIFTLLRNFTDRSIANYLALNMFLNNMNDLNSYFYLSRRKEETDIYYLNKYYLKWKKCVRWITKNMAPALGYEYLKRDFTSSMQKELQDMSQECINETADLIIQQEWITMKKYFREYVKQRINEIKVDFIAAFKRKLITNETEVNMFYDWIQYHPTNRNYLHNVFEYKKSMKIMELTESHLASLLDSIGSLFLVEAFGGSNMIDISFGMLLPPLYIPGVQRIMNLVSIGGVILHEVGHTLEQILDPNMPAFDPEGDAYYLEKKKCLEDQFSRFKFQSTGINLNGSKYLPENFADYVSMSVLDKLIEKYVSNNAVESLPSIPFSLKQQLYIYSAQLWCTISNKEKDEFYHNQHDHAPDKFRLQGMMQNSKGFSEAFSCPPGSYLNPVTKCSLFE